MENNINNNINIPIELIPKTIKIKTKKTSSMTQTQFPISQHKISITVKPKKCKCRRNKYLISENCFIKRLNSVDGKDYFDFIKKINFSNLKKSKLNLNKICYNLFPRKYKRIDTEIPNLRNLFSPKRNEKVASQLFINTEYKKNSLKIKKDLIKNNKYSLGGEDFNFCNLSKIKKYKNIVSSDNKNKMENDKKNYSLLEGNINNHKGIRLKSLRFVKAGKNKYENFINIDCN